MNRMNAGNPRNYDFARVPSTSIPRSRFYRPSSHITTMGCDYLYPLYCEEVLPGDTVRLDVATFARMTNAIVPFMSNLQLDWQFFFVPNRLVWANWQRFCGEQDNPDDSIDYTVPYLAPSDDHGGVSFKSIYDYMGIPPKVDWHDHDIIALPFRCYNLIWNEWYRDENLQNSVTVNKGDGPDSTDDYVLLPRGKRKDYFTGALPSPQKGPGVAVPLMDPEAGAHIPVRGNGKVLGFWNGATAGRSGICLDSNHNARFYQGAFNTAVDSSTSSSGSYAGIGKYGIVKATDGSSGLEADITSVGSSITINGLRQAFQMQKFFERLNRGGTRYIEILRSMFNVTSPDARLQRPELLTSFSVPLQLFQNTQTSATEDGSTPQGNLTANGVAAGARFAFNKSFVEHGYILGLCSIRSDQLYQQGLHRSWSRKTRYDFYWPTFAHLGEQAILNKELYLSGTSTDDQVFGYQERWSEYKYGQHRISGELRSSFDQTLDCWHLGQFFSNLPTLSADFIREQVPIDRVTAVATREALPFIVDVAFREIDARPMPLYDVPGLVDHF